MNFIQVENNPNLFRDKDTSAIININNDEFNKHIQRRNKLIAEQQRLDSFSNDITTLKSEINDIKSLLQQILERTT